jgi:PAS domain S-box-containing protein
VDQALARVGSFAAADRAVVFTRRPGTDVGDQTHEWCAPGVPSAKAGLQNLPPDRHPWVQRRLDADLPLVIPDVEQVPDEAAAERESWRRAGIKALAAVPITHRGSLIGVLGLNDCHGPRAWDEQTLALLQNVAVIFGNAMARAAADAALRRSNETARALLDGTDAVALLADCEGRLLACNRTTAKALGRPAEELLGQNGLALLPPSVRGVARDMLAEILRDRRPIRVEREFDRSWYLLSVTPVRGDGDEVARLALFARDITDIKNREIELRDALRRAQEAEVLKSRFLANMSHEIRTPLNHVIGMASVLLMQPEMPEDERVGCLKIVKRGGETMLALLTAILNLSKIESGKVEPNLAAFDFGEWAAGLRRRCDEMCAARRLAFRLWADPAIPATLMGDRAMIEQALEALVDNACKFTKRGGVDVSITLAELDGPAGAAQIAFAVADTGIGISAEDLPRVFDSFFQVDSSTTRELGGVGLGLTIARELARILGGRIEAVSTLGEGSVFTLFCPFRLREKDDAAE